MELYTRERAMEWLNKHWQSPSMCPICQHNNWTISDSVMVMLPLVDNRINVGGPVLPLFSLICGTCGYTLLFNALVAGLMSTQENIAAPSEEKKKN